MNYSGIKTKPGLVVKYVSSNFRTKTQPASYDELVKEREPGSRIWITEQGFTLKEEFTSLRFVGRPPSNFKPDPVTGRKVFIAIAPLIVIVDDYEADLKRRRQEFEEERVRLKQVEARMARIEEVLEPHKKLLREHEKLHEELRLKEMRLYTKLACGNCKFNVNGRCSKSDNEITEYFVSYCSSFDPKAKEER